MIWCLFSVENNYNQPPNNLEAWWKEKPSLEVLFSFFNVTYNDPDSVVKVVKIWDWAREEQRINNVDYRLVRIKEGKIEL